MLIRQRDKVNNIPHERGMLFPAGGCRIRHGFGAWEFFLLKEYGRGIFPMGSDAAAGHKKTAGEAAVSSVRSPAGSFSVFLLSKNFV